MTLTNFFKRRTFSLIAVLGLSFAARAQDGGVLEPLEEPKVTILPDSTYLFNKRAFEVTNEEMKRLQGVERLHKSENALIPILIGLGVGTAVGVTTGIVIGFVVRPVVLPDKQ